MVAILLMVDNISKSVFNIIMLCAVQTVCCLLNYTPRVSCHLSTHVVHFNLSACVAYIALRCYTDTVPTPQSAVLDGALQLLVQLLANSSNSISFPEVSFPITVRVSNL